MTFKEKQIFYNEVYTLGNLNCTFTEKMALISLICHLYKEFKKKKPDITYYQIVYKIGEPLSVPDEIIQALSIICEDFAYGCSEFPTFDLKNKEIISKIKEILKRYMPF